MQCSYCPCNESGVVSPANDWNEVRNEVHRADNIDKDTYDKGQVCPRIVFIFSCGDVLYIVNEQF